MTDLRSNLRELTEPSREVDAEIARRMGKPEPIYDPKDGYPPRNISEHYTSDLNVVVALVEERFPDCTYFIGRIRSEGWEAPEYIGDAEYAYFMLIERGPNFKFSAFHLNRPLAACLALLEAMEGE